ncbi:MAG: hypothetical protein LBV12_06580 [Puniceicoccales bacterium]|jgi:hypothetical protein|nr:hypothetical protein [Puniceicoccales bacterium]
MSDDFSFAAVHDVTIPLAGTKCLLDNETKSFDFLFASADENEKSNGKSFASLHDRVPQMILPNDTLHHGVISFAGTHHEEYNGDSASCFHASNLNFTRFPRCAGYSSAGTHHASNLNFTRFPRWIDPVS